MATNYFLRRWSKDFDLLEPPRGFGADFYQEFDLIRQSHLKRMNENFENFFHFEPRFFKRETHISRRPSFPSTNFNHDIDTIRKHQLGTFLDRFDSNLLMKPRVPETRRIRVDCTGYPADSIKVSVSEDKRSLIVSGREGDNTDPDKDYSFKEFKIVYGLPANTDTLRISSSLKSNGHLIIDVPFIVDKHAKKENFDSKINVKKVHFGDNASKVVDSKTVAYEEKPLNPKEEEQILTRITEESYCNKVKISGQGVRFNLPLEKELILENDDTVISRLIPIEMTSGIKSNISNCVNIPIQIVNRNKN